tara:strand:- start:9398 stop:11350 length:1953 start_codon:yes stop_codon:yes gene_type:complete
MFQKLFLFFIFLWLSPEAHLYGQSEALKIKANQLIVLNGEAEASTLFDESHLFKGAKVPSEKAEHFFRASYNEIYLPQEMLIPLQALYRLDSLWLFDGAGKDEIEVLIGNPKSWQSALKTQTDLYNQWRSFALKGEGEFILLKVYSSQAQIGELRFFGEKVSEAKAENLTELKATRPRRTVREIFGINAFVDDPLDIVAPVASSIREYHNWDWDEANGDVNYNPTKGKEFAWSPSYVSVWDFDRYYGEAKKKGIAVFPCLQGTALPYRGEADFNSKPTYKELNPDQSQSYRHFAEYAYQFAARYGNNPVDASLLLLRDDQEARSGLNLIAGLEVWNEPDKWWKGRKGYFHPFEFAAFLNAAYDGQEGRMGPKVGIKKADPNLPVIMGGLAETNLDYLLGIKYWSDYNRKGEFPAQVLNFHHYSNNAGGQNGNATSAASPERDSLKQRLDKLVQFRNVNFPQLEIWLSEFGYDSNPKSPQGVPSIGAFSPEEVQAIWLLRTYLAIAASGLDRAHLYMLRDVNAPNPNKYNSSGLRAEKWNKHAPKTSYFALQSFLSLVGDYHFAKVLPQSDESVFVYQFDSQEGGSHIWAIWLGTESAKQLFNYALKVPATSVNVYQFAPSFLWEKSTQTSAEGTFKLKISEKPIFIKWHD